MTNLNIYEVMAMTDLTRWEILEGIQDGSFPQKPEWRKDTIAEWLCLQKLNKRCHPQVTFLGTVHTMEKRP